MTFDNDDLRSTCMNYKKYKKISKDVTLAKVCKIFTQLRNDVKLVCGTFNKYRKDPNSIGMLIKYTKFNVKCIYKVCKRLDKRLCTTIFMQWFRKIQTQRRKYKIFNKAYLASVEEECPICFDPVQEAIALSCGHSVCVKCALGMLSMSQRNGTIHNLIAYGRYCNANASKCPLCRDALAFNNYTLRKVK